MSFQLNYGNRFIIKLMRISVTEYLIFSGEPLRAGRSFSRRPAKKTMAGKEAKARTSNCSEVCRSQASGNLSVTTWGDIFQLSKYFYNGRGQKPRVRRQEDARRVSQLSAILGWIRDNQASERRIPNSCMKRLSVRRLELVWISLRAASHRLSSGFNPSSRSQAGELS